MSIVPKQVVLEWLNEWNQLPITADTPLSWEYMANRAAEWVLGKAAELCDEYGASDGHICADEIRALMKGGESDEN
jgi:hypothetical protein